MPSSDHGASRCRAADTDPALGRPAGRRIYCEDETHGHEALKAMNGRIEVPVLVDDDVVVVNSAYIVAYLDAQYPPKPVYPPSVAARVHARAWERAADSYVDAILINISYWLWADREDTMPDGLLEAARADMAQVYKALERDLGTRDYISGPLSIADLALFPHIASAKALGVEFSADKQPRFVQWFRQMRALPICAADLRRTRDFVASLRERDIERRRIFWRGDRIEWMLARGFHKWLFNEVTNDRVLWPGPTLPAPLAEHFG